MIGRGRGRAVLKHAAAASRGHAQLRLASGPEKRAQVDVCGPLCRSRNRSDLEKAEAVGTGFSDPVAKALCERMDRIVAPRCPVAGLKVAGAVWVTPDLRAEIAYRGVTTAGELRHASFKGLAE